MPRILLVDDDREFLRLTKAYLADEDPIFDVVTTNSPQNALIRLAEEHFDAVVSDYKMPRIDGLKLLARLRENNNLVPFIMFTSHSREEIAIRALNLGADYYLPKGGDPQSQYAELAHIIRSTISSRWVYNALRESEERYRSLVENIPIGMYRTTPGPKGKFLMINSAMVSMLGYESEAALKEVDVADVYLDPDEREFYSNKLLAQESMVGEEVRLKKKDGTPIWASITARVIYREDGQIAYFDGLLEDITERKQAEQALLESEKRYRTLFQEIPVGILVSAISGRILSINTTALELLGSPSIEATKKINLLTFPPLQEAGISDDLRQCIKTSRSISGERPYISKWGKSAIFRYKIMPIQNERGEITQVLGTFVDISKLKRAEEELSASEEKYHNLLVKLQEGVLVEDEEGKISFVNPQTVKMLGYASDNELIGRHWTTIVPPSELEEIKAQAAIRQHGVSSTYEANLLAKDNHNVPVKISATPLFNPSGVFQGVLSVFTDIRDQLATEKALRESEEKYRSIVENSLQGILIVGEDYRFSYVNDELCKILGRERDEIIGEDFRKFLDEESATLVADRYVRRQRGEAVPSRYEFNILRKDGEKRRVEISSAVIEDSFDHKNTIAQLLDITERKKAEDALRESEERYRTILENIEDGYYEVDLAGNFTFFNEGVRRILGYTADELMGMNNREYMEPETAKRMYKVFNAVYQTGKPTKVIDWENVRKDGTITVMEGSISLVKDPTGNPVGFRGIVRDVTERKQADTALQESEERYRTLVESIPIGLSRTSPGPKGKFLMANPAILEFFGYESETELKQINVADVYANPNDRIAFSENLLAQGGVSRAELQYKKKDGTPIWGAITARVVADKEEQPYFDCVIEDITAQKQAEAALIETQERYRELIEKMREGVWTGDAEGYSTFINPQTAEMLGYTQNEMLGMHWTKLVPPEEHDKIREIDATREHGVSSTYEAVLLRKDGYNLPVIISGTPLFTSSGAFRGTMAVFTDISELKQVEEELKRQKEELSEFAHAMNHDLQNRLHNIKGYAALIRKRKDFSYTDKIEQLVSNASDLLRESVALADAGLVVEKTSGVDLSQLVRQTARNVIPEGISFIQDALPKVACDRTKVIQVFQNLFENAVIHGNPKTIEVRQQKTKDGISIRIANDGIPIPPEYRSDVFDRKFTTRKKGGGLGLAIIQKVVEAHGWEISLEPTSETVFRIFIPNPEGS
ncbi:MAG: PAS domain S-box protein [Candidatus Thorarchaeota archaeon]